jgi:nitrogen fixation protein FixH
MKLRWHWGWGITLVYAAFAASTAGFVAFAMGQKVELVSEDYYQRAIEFDRHMAATANAAALGQTVRIEAAARSHGVTLAWDAAPPRPGEGTIIFYRPSDASVDHTVPLEPDADGRQWIPLGNAPPGHWIVRLAWRADGREYLLERSVTVK